MFILKYNKICLLHSIPFSLRCGFHSRYTFYHHWIRRVNFWLLTCKQPRKKHPEQKNSFEAEFLVFAVFNASQHNITNFYMQKYILNILCGIWLNWMCFLHCLPHKSTSSNKQIIQIFFELYFFGLFNRIKRFSH